MTDILIVEDDKNLSTILCDFLKVKGYTVHQSFSGEDAVEFCTSERVKLVLLDVMLPSLDGIGVCRKLRQNDDMPIIIISAKSDKDTKLSGLEMGADDYIEKPYDIDIMLAKIAGIFKRRYSSENITDGNLSIDIKAKKVTVNGKEISMTVKEYELLVLLVENKGKTLSKDYIFNKIWGADSYSEPQTLTVHIKWLRSKIEDDVKNPVRLKTVWGVGYRFE